jgi:hypothetical protein
MAEGVPKTDVAAGLPKIEVGWAGLGLPNAEVGVEVAPKTDPPPKTELPPGWEVAPNAGDAAGCPNAEPPNMEVPEVGLAPNTEGVAAGWPNAEGAGEPKTEVVGWVWGVVAYGGFCAAARYFARISAFIWAIVALYWLTLPNCFNWVYACHLASSMERSEPINGIFLSYE